jgi:hypothetical protein
MWLEFPAPDFFLKISPDATGEVRHSTIELALFRPSRASKLFVNFLIQGPLWSP